MPGLDAKMLHDATHAHGSLSTDLKRIHGSKEAIVWPGGVAPGDVAAWEELRRAEALSWADAQVEVVTSDPGLVLVAGDWHGQTYWAVTSLLLAVATGASLVVQVGDMGVWTGAKGQRFLDTVSSTAVRLGVSVVFVDGNHEDFAQLYRTPVHASGWRPLRPGVLHAPRGLVKVLSGRRVGFLGGATSLDRPTRTPMVTWWPEEDITQGDLYRLESEVGDVPLDVLFTHDAPSGSKIPGLDPHAFAAVEVHRARLHRLWVDEAVRVARPGVLYHGHVHVHHVQHVVVEGHRFLSVGLDRDGAGLGSFALHDLRA